MSGPEGEFEFFAEWKIRRIPSPQKEPKDTYIPRLKDWALSSIGIDGKAKEVFLHLENSKAATLEDLETQFNEKPEALQEILDDLYSNGLIERIGKAYFVRESLSAAIVKRLIPRITESLRNVAKVESKSRVDVNYYHKLKGRSYTDVGSAIAAYKEISRLGRSPRARVVGTHSYNGESIEVEGPIINFGYSPQHMVIITESGERMTIGNRDSRGTDVKAHSILIEGDRSD
ncbi:MAG: hypothetical protein JSV35_00985 [Candidatus Bathyarchaeota archaeon]|nr:MAG: hypothetical protein JSV35_00985 [Candidatus Bathyarchaeota archaeon]